MSFNIMCPHCRTTLEAQEQWAGMECECPQCHEKILIPAPTVKPSPLKMVAPLRQSGATQEDMPQSDEPRALDIYNPWGIHICLALAALLMVVLTIFVWWRSFLFFLPLPLLGFWFLKCNFEELGDAKRRRNSAIFFYLGIIMSAIFAVDLVIVNVLDTKVTGALSIVMSLLALFQILTIPYWVAAIVDSGKLPGLLKKEHGGRAVKIRSPWLMWLLAPLLLLLLVGMLILLANK